MFIRLIGIYSYQIQPKKAKALPVRFLSFLKFSACAAFSLVLTTPALAVDSEAFVARLQDILKQNGSIMQNTGVDINDNDITLHNVTIHNDDTTPDEKTFISLGDIFFRKIEEGNDGSWRIKKITSADSTDKDSQEQKEKKHLAAKGIEIENVYLAPKDKPHRTGEDPLPYRSLKVREAIIYQNDKALLYFDNLASNNEQKKAGKSIRSKFSVAFRYDLAFLPEEEGKELVQAALASLDYSGLEGTFQFSYGWEPVKGDLDPFQLDITVKDAGKFGISVQMGGITREFGNRFEEFLKSLSLSGSLEEANAVALLGLLQKINLKKMLIRYDDHSFVNRLSANVGKGRDQTREEIVSDIQKAVPFWVSLAGVSDHPFADKVVKEINTFLDHPKSLEISAKPAKPVPLSVIVGLAVTAPQQIIEIFGIDISANR